MIEGCALSALLLLLGVGTLASMTCGALLAFRQVVVKEAGRRGWTEMQFVRCWPSHGEGFDGLYTGHESGDLYEVYDPAWWQFRRWAEWHLSRGRARGTVSLFHYRDGERVTVDVRAMSARYVPPSPKRRYVDRSRD